MVEIRRRGVYITWYVEIQFEVVPIMAKQKSQDELMAEFFRMLMADAQQAQKQSAPHEVYTMDSFPRYRDTDRVLKYTVRVALRGIKPPIWRKVTVPSNISLRLFGDLILELMGWMGEHLNQFRKGDSYYAPAYQREEEMPPLYGRIENYNQEDFTLGEVLSEKGDTMVWEYDFGDSWEHDVRLSSVDEYADGEPREIVFIGGKRACPPEDCGGIWGYEELLKLHERRIARKRISADDRERLEWYGMDRDFDPEWLSLEECREIVEAFNS